MTDDLFGTWFAVLTGYEPMPWQRRLYQEHFSSGNLPAAVNVPTGLGKTAVMAVWLIALAQQFQQDKQPKLPRRLVYVVDRRAVVDQSTSFAEMLRDKLSTDTVADLRFSLGFGDKDQLPISTLRGQFVDNREWLEHPSRPAIIVGTVDMIGSRLLFEGYGVSRKMRPYQAGFLGVDALVILDEAHLVPPFEHLLRSIATELAFRPSDGSWQKYVPPFKLIALSATGRTQSGSAVGLTEKDFKHEIVKKRLNAKKALRIMPLDGETKLEDALATQAWRLADEGRKPERVLVYSDGRDVAQKAKAAVERLAKGDRKQGTPEVEIETELFVGGRRVFEREDAKKRLESHGFIAGRTVERSRPVFLFATSAGEVGVDLDANHMVCDLVAWERMVQRLGRVNRRGEPESHVANIVVLVEPKPKPDKKEQAALDKRAGNEELDEKEGKRVEGYEKKVREWENRQKPIEHLPKYNDGSCDASPGAVWSLNTRTATDSDLRKILEEATTPEPLRPAMTRPLIDAWAMTSLEKHAGRPAIQPWLRGWIEDDPPQTAIVWRRHLPVRAEGPSPRKKEIEAFFEAAPPHTSEILETETFRVVKWIAERADKLRKRQSEQANATDAPRLYENDVVAFALDAGGGLRKPFTLEEIAKTKDKEELSRLLAGATLVLDARLGGLKDGLLDDKEDTLPRTADDGEPWLGEGVVGFRVRSIETSAVVPHERNWLERFRFPSAATEDGEATRWFIVEKWRHDAATEEDRSAADHPQLLDEHQSWTEERARHMAKALGLDDGFVEVLALAARLHDEGKRAARWQRAFHAPKDGVYAKTEGPIDYRLLDGYRHELGSLLRVENDERILKLSDGHRDLVLHLIAAHHGFARPVIGTSGCEDGPPSVLEQKVAEIALRFARLQARWGPWGLAWWEALLRAADQQASRDNDARAAAQGGA